MIAYLKKVKQDLANFWLYDVIQIPRVENSNADALARFATSKDADLLKVVPVEQLDTPLIEETDQIAMPVDQAESWMSPIIRYLLDVRLPEEKNEA